MPNELIPPEALASPSIKHLPVEKRIELWAELIDESEALVLAHLRARIGDQGDLQAAYRQWYSRQMEEHDRKQIRFAQNLTQREAGCDQ